MTEITVSFNIFTKIPEPPCPIRLPERSSESYFVQAKCMYYYQRALSGLIFKSSLFLYIFSSDLPRGLLIRFHIFQMAVVKKFINTPPTLNLTIDDKLDSPDSLNILEKYMGTEAESPISPNVLEKSINEDQPHNFPEGGLKAYLTVLGAFMAFASIFGRMSAFGIYQVWYGSNQLQHLSASTISWIGSLQYGIFFVSVRFNISFSSFPPHWISGQCHRTLVRCIWTNLANDCRDPL
jgi:hypothetical protein